MEEHHHLPLLVVQLPQGTAVLLQRHEFLTRFCSKALQQCQELISSYFFNVCLPQPDRFVHLKMLYAKLPSNQYFTNNPLQKWICVACVLRLWCSLWCSECCTCANCTYMYVQNICKLLPYLVHVQHVCYLCVQHALLAHMHATGMPHKCLLHVRYACYLDK